MYGSNFWIVTLMPRLFKSRPSDAAVIPLPKEDTTPPVTKIYFAILLPPAHACLFTHVLYCIFFPCCRQTKILRQSSWIPSSSFSRRRLDFDAAAAEVFDEAATCVRFTSGGFHSV